MPNSNPKIYALAIIAHPDDEAFLLAGTCMKFAEDGKTTAIVCATKGEKGADRLDRHLTPHQMAEIRAKELKAACSMLHCPWVELFDYPDGSLDQVEVDELVSHLVGKIDEYKPEIILTFGPEGISGHKDHIVIGKAAIAAAQQTSSKPKEIWLASIPVSVMPKFREHQAQRKVHHSHFRDKPLEGVPDEKLLKIDIRKFAEAKRQAIKIHESQYISHLTIDLFLEYEYFEVIKLPLAVGRQVD